MESQVGNELEKSKETTSRNMSPMVDRNMPPMVDVNKTIRKQREMQTYIKIGGEELQGEESDVSDSLEIDLVFLREKGRADQFLEISFTGLNPQTSTRQEAKKVINNKAEFDALKKFFEQLNWGNET